MGFAGRVLVNCDEAGHAAALHEDLAHPMAGRLGRGHAHVDARRRHDGLEVNIEAVRKQQQLARREIGANLLGIQLGRGLIGNQDHHHIRPFCGFGDGSYFKAGFLRLGDGFGTGGKAHLHLDTGILEVESMSVPLRAVSDDGHFFGLDEGKVGVLIVISLGHDFSFFLFLSDVEVDSLGSLQANLGAPSSPRLCFCG